MKALTVFVFIFLSPLSSVASESIEKEWEIFKNKFNKTYESSVEEAEKLKIFQENFEYVRRHNKNASATFKLELTQGADEAENKPEAR
jgi:hypothetical protein